MNVEWTEWLQLMADAKSTPAYSYDLHFLGAIMLFVGTIMQLSVQSQKIRDLHNTDKCRPKD